MTPGRRRGAPVADRWPKGVAAEYVGVPALLLRQARDLGLSDGHLRLLLAIEVFRRGDGTEPVYASQATLAELCGCSVSQVERRIHDLRKRGLIEVERRARPGGKRPNHYTRRGLDRALAALVAQESNPAPTRDSSAGSNTASTRGTDAGYPAPVRDSNPSSTRATYPAPMRAEEEVGEEEAGTHARRARDLAHILLDCFNERAGTDYTLDTPHGRVVIERVAEHPALTEAEHRRIIEAAFRRPWWDGIPSPRVIYSAEQFEHARQELSERAARNAATTEAERFAERTERRRRQLEAMRKPRKPWAGALARKRQEERAAYDVEGSAIEEVGTPVEEASPEDEARAESLLARYEEARP
jgi:CRP-like cAMP-binding protein